MSTSGIMEYLPPVCAVNIVGSVITTCAFNVSKQYGVCDDEFVRSFACSAVKAAGESRPGSGFRGCDHHRLEPFILKGLFYLHG